MVLRNYKRNKSQRWDLSRRARGRGVAEPHQRFRLGEKRQRVLQLWILLREILSSDLDAEEIDVDLESHHCANERQVLLPGGFLNRDSGLLHKVPELADHGVGHLEVLSQLAKLPGRTGRNPAVAGAREALRVGIEEVSREECSPEPRRIEPFDGAIKPTVRLDT